MKYIISIGKATHLKVSNVGTFAACGVSSELLAWDTRDVDCLRCRKTKKWKLYMDGRKMQNTEDVRKFYELYPKATLTDGGL